MRTLRSLPIRHKLLLMVMLPGLIAVVIMTAFDFFRDYTVARRALDDELARAAQRAAYDSVPLLMFEDRREAGDLLLSLASHDAVAAAAIYDADGNLFARFERDAALGTLYSREEVQRGAMTGGDGASLMLPIEHRGRPIGTVYIEGSLAGLRARSRASLIFNLALMLVCGTAAFLLAHRFQRFLADPILHLAETARTVSETKDYALRAVKETDDELGTLVGRFNEMLEQIQRRDRALNTEIDERISAETRMREAEREFRVLFERSPDAIIIIDPATFAPIEWNTRAVALLGFSHNEFRALRIYDLSIDSETPAHAEEHLSALIKKGGGEWNTTWRRKDGVTLHVFLHLTVLNTGNRMLTFLTIHDVTARVKAEETRAMLEAHLRQSQKMEAIGTLAGGIAHDFNNILAAVLGYAELSLMELEPGGKVHKNISNVVFAANRAKELVRQILTFSRQLDQARAPVKLRGILRETLKLLRATMPATIEIHADIERVAALVMADPTQIQQVVMNLCTNAYHAMRDRGGHLYVSLDEVIVTDEDDPPGLEPGHYLRISVRDTGHGMSARTMERIFEPFFTTKGIGDGTGMGLSIVHGIVRNHGGRVFVQSQLGEGATFEVYLPRVVEEELDHDPASVNLPAPETTGVVLYVDDEEMLTQLAEEVLGKYGYDVVGTTSPGQALELFEEDPGRFDIVITDQTMPGMTGLALAERIRIYRPEIPVIIATGFSETLSQQSVKESATSVLMKPIVVEELLKTVNEALVQPVA